MLSLISTIKHSTYRHMDLTNIQTIRSFILPFLACSLFFISCSTNNTPVYQVTANADPAEAGTVSPGTEQADEGERVSIQANPNEHWVFKEWTGDHTGTQNPASILMDKDKTITAQFEKRDYALTINIEGEGRVDETVIQSKSSEYPHGTVVELTAVPEEGWTFIKWTGDYEGDDESITLTVDEETTITAIFEKVEHRHEGGKGEYEATSQGEVIIKTDLDGPDYDEVHFDFEIYYDDGTPVPGAKLFYEEVGKLALIRIESTTDDGGGAVIAGTPEELLSLLEQNSSKIKKAGIYHNGSVERVVIAGSLIVSGIIILKKAAIIYQAYQTGRAIWDTALQVREITTFFTESIKLEEGGKLYCKTTNEILELSTDISEVFDNTGKIIKTFKSPPGTDKIIGDFAYDVTVGKGVEKVETYVTDLIYDTILRKVEENPDFASILDLGETPIGVKIYEIKNINLPEYKGEEPKLVEVYLDYELCKTPQITTKQVTSIQTTSAQSGGQVIAEGGSAVTSRGVCWNTSQRPTISDNCTSDGSGPGSFSSNLNNLSAETEYYVRAFATNNFGTNYGNQINFRTQLSVGKATVIPSEGKPGTKVVFEVELDSRVASDIKQIYFEIDNTNQKFDMNKAENDLWKSPTLEAPNASNYPRVDTFTFFALGSDEELIGKGEATFTITAPSAKVKSLEQNETGYSIN